MYEPSWTRRLYRGRRSEDGRIGGHWAYEDTSMACVSSSWRHDVVVMGHSMR
jgi:hypothetical protein